VHDLEFYNSCEYQNGLANAISNENTIYITKIKYRKDGSLKKFKITNEAAYIVDESNEVFEIKVKYKIQVISEPGFTLKDGENFIKADPIQQIQILRGLGWKIIIGSNGVAKLINWDTWVSIGPSELIKIKKSKPNPIVRYLIETYISNINKSYYNLLLELNKIN
jgi:hypothetical protein